ncbi:ABC transporter substrate-binding protein [Arthrobacter sp. FW306-04-A]|uniref:ABC transporter substrate-binding protein n=1 Tax=Arthrobacter sp. FW306-04-A TaxID=2879619 RepID=UPI0037C0510E|nr:ABC transporter substrate-binding protein [Arthrobacter sp. FW306-04-A]
MSIQPKRPAGVVAVLAAGALLLTGCGGMSAATTNNPAPANSKCAATDTVKVVLQWVTQAQFAGYYQAQEKGYYAANCLDVTIQEGGNNVSPQQVLASGNADIAVTQALPSMASREAGSDLVDIGQVFQKGAFLQVSWADSGIHGIKDLKGTKMGSWGSGNETVLYAALRANGVEPTTDVNVIQQPFDVSPLLKNDVQSIQAKTYNEYAQLLETVNPKTGKLFQPSDFSVLNLNDFGYQTLEDAIYSRDSWLADPKHKDAATRFLAASYKGWIDCRDNAANCVDSVLKNGSALGKGHQSWMINEVNKLIWPNDKGIGYMDPAVWDKAMKNGVDGKAIKALPQGGYRTDINDAALALLKAEGVDVKGASYKPLSVTPTAGGK